jgi:hypothetical protein
MTRGRTVRASAAVAGVLLAAMTVGGCAESGGSGGGTTETTATPSASAPATVAPSIADVTPEPGAVGSGIPGDATPPDDAGSPGAGWTADDGLLYVVTFGPSTFPIVAEPEANVTEGSLQVTLTGDTAGPCTMDFVPTTSVVQVPDDVDQSAPITVYMGEGQDVTVQPRPADGEAGPIAWAAAH